MILANDLCQPSVPRFLDHHHNSQPHSRLPRTPLDAAPLHPPAQLGLLGSDPGGTAAYVNILKDSFTTPNFLLILINSFLSIEFAKSISNFRFVANSINRLSLINMFYFRFRIVYSQIIAHTDYVILNKRQNSPENNKFEHSRSDLVKQ